MVNPEDMDAILEGVKMRLWVGFMVDELFNLVDFSLMEFDSDFCFEANGEPGYLPFGQSLMEVANEHYAFFLLARKDYVAKAALPMELGVGRYVLPDGAHRADDGRPAREPLSEIGAAFYEEGGATAGSFLPINVFPPESGGQPFAASATCWSPAEACSNFGSPGPCSCGSCHTSRGRERDTRRGDAADDEECQGAEGEGHVGRFATRPLIQCRGGGLRGGRRDYGGRCFGARGRGPLAASRAQPIRDHEIPDRRQDEGSGIQDRERLGVLWGLFQRDGCSGIWEAVSCRSTSLEIQRSYMAGWNAS